MNAKRWRNQINHLLGTAMKAPVPLALVGRNGRLVPYVPSKLGAADSEISEWEQSKTKIRALLAEMMVRTGLLSSQYKAWVVPAGGDTRKPVVMIRLDRSIQGHSQRQIELENELAAYAKKRHGLEIEDVVWLGTQRLKPRTVRNKPVDIDFLLEAPIDFDAPTQLLDS